MARFRSIVLILLTTAVSSSAWAAPCGFALVAQRHPPAVFQGVTLTEGAVARMWEAGSAGIAGDLNPCHTGCRSLASGPACWWGDGCTALTGVNWLNAQCTDEGRLPGVSVFLMEAPTPSDGGRWAALRLAAAAGSAHLDLDAAAAEVCGPGCGSLASPAIGAGTGTREAAFRFDTLAPAGLDVDEAPGTGTTGNLNGVLEPGETVLVAPRWANHGSGAVDLTTVLRGFVGPPGAVYTVVEASADHGVIGAGQIGGCAGNCLVLSVSQPDVRPALHWDVTFSEVLPGGEVVTRTIHIGESFSDVPPGHWAYRFIETLLHNNVTTGCGGGMYCPGAGADRRQAALWLARAITGGDGAVPMAGLIPGVGSYSCGSGGESRFADVAPDDALCPHAHFLWREGVSAGCDPGGGLFCPGAMVTRAKMAVMVARARLGGDAAVPQAFSDPFSGRAYDCSPGSGAVHFGDVPSSHPACRHVHYLWATSIIEGCDPGGGLFCPDSAVLRDKAAILIGAGLALSLDRPIDPAIAGEPEAEPALFPLGVVRTGTGAGTVTSAPSGIDCGDTCLAGFEEGTPVVLTAEPSLGNSFSGWSGEGCSGTGTCEVTMSEAWTVTATFDMEAPPELTLGRTHLNFGGTDSGGVITSEQLVTVDLGGAPLAWTAVADHPDILVSGGSGTGAGAFTVAIAPGTAGSFTSTVTVTAPGAGNSPRTVTVVYTSHAPGATEGPFGHFDTPVDGATGLSGNIPVTGWVLDDIEVVRVDIWRDPMDGEPVHPNGHVYLGEAVFVAGTRPDVEAAYPNHPMNDRAGWGLMVLTNFLPSGGVAGTVGGNGTFVLHAWAHDAEGHSVLLGSKTITCDNDNATAPFGTIDTPGQGETVSGVVVNFGWALTPQPGIIPEDGSTIWVFLNGVPVGQPVYGNYREDIATLFPGYANVDGAVGYFVLDTTALPNGLHNIGWSVTDDLGRVSGIGSRYIWVFN